MKRDLTIEPAGDGEFMVVEHDVYPRSSVLAGQRPAQSPGILSND